MPQIFDIFVSVIDVFLTYTRQLTCLDESLVWWCGWVRVGVETRWTTSLELALLKIGLGLVGEELQLMMFK
jgi:hypothetical protein